MIDKCRFCSSQALLEILHLGNISLANFTEKIVKDNKYPLALVKCGNCKLVQLNNTVSQRLLYNDSYGYYSRVNNTMRTHLKDLVKQATRRVDLIEDDFVIDIGSNDGCLIENYPVWVNKVGFDIVSKFAKFYQNIPRAHFINKPFTKKEYDKSFGRKAKIITAISMFYDIDDPNKFVSDVKQILHKEGIFIIQQNYLPEMLKNNAFDNIVHEHLEYYDLQSLEYLLTQHELEIIEAEVNSLNGGSLRTYIKHKTQLSRLRDLEGYEDFDKFVRSVKKIKKDLFSFMQKEYLKNKKIYLYGASTRIGTLLQYCDIGQFISKAVERNENKVGKYYNNIPIISEEQGRKENPDYFFIGPWFFISEFIEREKEYLKKGGKFIIPLPNFKIIDYEIQLERK